MLSALYQKYQFHQLHLLLYRICSSEMCTREPTANSVDIINRVAYNISSGFHNIIQHFDKYTQYFMCLDVVGAHYNCFSVKTKYKYTLNSTSVYRSIIRTTKQMVFVFFFAFRWHEGKQRCGFSSFQRTVISIVTINAYI